MEVRQMATAFLIYQEHVLMMRKANSKIFNFEFWGGIRLPFLYVHVTEKR